MTTSTVLGSVRAGTVLAAASLVATLGRGDMPNGTQSERASSINGDLVTAGAIGMPYLSMTHLGPSNAERGLFRVATHLSS